MHPSSLREMTEVEAAWVGATIEAEGTISRRTQKPQIIEIRVGSSSVETIATLLRLRGVGTVYLHSSAASPLTKKTIWDWVVFRKLDSLALISAVSPYLVEKP